MHPPPQHHHPQPHHHFSNHHPSLQNHHVLETFKQEPGIGLSSSGYVDLDQCAAALEKDGPDLINSDFDTLNDLIISLQGDSEFTSDDLKSLCFDGDEELSFSDTLLGGGCGGNSSNSTNPGVGGGESHPGLTPITPSANCSSAMMHHHNQHHPGVKMESGHIIGVGMMAGGGHPAQAQCAGPSPAPATTASPLASQLAANNNGSTPPYLFSSDPSGSPSASAQCQGPNKPGGSGGGRVQPSLSGSSLPIDSPAAQTLKQMAEQHQHKQQMGGSGSGGSGNGNGTPTNINSFNNKNASPARSPFNEYGGGGNNNNDFMGANSNPGGGGGGSGFQQPSHPPPSGSVKQEVYSPTNQTTFSPGYMDVNHGGVNVKGQRGLPPPQQQQQQQQMSHGGSGRMGGQQILSPIPKSFNPGNGMESQSLMSGQSFLSSRPQPSNNSLPNNPNPNNPPSYPLPFPGGQGGPMPNPNQQQQVNYTVFLNFTTITHFYCLPCNFQMAGRGSPSNGPMAIDPKTRLAQQQTQYYYQQQQPQPQQQNPNLNPSSMVDPSSQFNPNGPQQGQTINFTQQHLRIGGPGGGPGTNVGIGVGNMPPRMGGGPGPGIPPNMNTNMNRIPGPGGPPRPSQQQQGQQPLNSQQQQQQMMMRQQQQQQHMAQQQQLGNMGQPGMMNRFPGKLRVEIKCLCFRK